jgi:hypothetical protein
MFLRVLRRRIWFPISGGVLIATTVVLAAFVLGFLDWASSVCHDDAARIAEQRRQLRQYYLLVWLSAAAVPVIWAFLARMNHRRVWPWAAVAAILVFTAVWGALTAQPSTWCLF